MFFTTLLLALAGTPADEVHARTSFTTIATIYEAELSDDGTILLSTMYGLDRFRLMANAPHDQERLIAMVERIWQAGDTIRIQFEANSGEIEQGGMLITYQACSASKDDELIDLSGECGDELDLATLTQAGKLAVANAFMSEGHSEPAEDIIFGMDPASLPSDDARIALHYLATQLHSHQIGHFAPASHEADEAAVSAYRSNEQLAKLRPRIPAPRYEQATMLATLGAYEEAIARYRQVAEDFPFFASQAGIAIARTQLDKGEPEAALETLNVVFRDGPGEHYLVNYYRSRGLALIALGRAHEAIAAFNSALDGDPGNNWALRKRACAYAMTGKLALATADLEKARALTEEYSQFNRTDDDRAEMDRMEETITLMSEAAQRGSEEAMPQICLGYDDDPKPPRDRSPLLDELLQ